MCMRKGTKRVKYVTRNKKSKWYKEYEKMYKEYISQYWLRNDLYDL